MRRPALITPLVVIVWLAGPRNEACCHLRLITFLVHARQNEVPATLPKPPKAARERCMHKHQSLRHNTFDNTAKLMQELPR